MIKAVFIVGNKRSGSTQLMHLLNLHPNIFISNESDIIWILYRFHQGLDIIPYQWDTPLGMNATLEKYRDLLSKDKTPMENFITLQTTLMREGSKKLVPMDKEHLLWIGDQKPFQQIDPEILPFIKTHFPNSRFIHLIRHPFPTVQSSKVFIGDLWKGMTEAEILHRWTMHETWVEQEKQKQEVPMLDIKYEDIVEHTQASLAKMFDFLEVPYNKSLLQEGRQLTRRLLKYHPPLPCPPETQAIMQKYGYAQHNLRLESPLFIKSMNFLRRLQRKVTGTW